MIAVKGGRVKHCVCVQQDHTSRLIVSKTVRSLDRRTARKMF